MGQIVFSAAPAQSMISTSWVSIKQPYMVAAIFRTDVTSHFAFTLLQALPCESITLLQVSQSSSLMGGLFKMNIGLQLTPDVLPFSFSLPFILISPNFLLQFFTFSSPSN